MNIVKKLWGKLKEFYDLFNQGLHEIVRPSEYNKENYKSDIKIPPPGYYIDYLSQQKQINMLKHEVNQLRNLVDYYKKESYKKKPKKELKDNSPEQQSKLIAWANRVKQVGYCDICNSTNKLTAHHLYDKSTHPSLKFIDENGVCLCERCHNKFHQKYTDKSHCTPKLYEKFKIILQNEMTMSKLRINN